MKLTIPSGLPAFVATCLISVQVAFATDNVLLIIADDYGVDSMGIYAPGEDTAPTPNLDALAASGIRFTEFWANPICSPTRAAILTGRHGFRTGVGSPQGNNTIPLTEYTLADAMNSVDLLVITTSVTAGFLLASRSRINAAASRFVQTPSFAALLIQESSRFQPKNCPSRSKSLRCCS